MADLRHFHFVFTLRRLNPCFTQSMPHPTFSVIFKVQNIPYLSCSCERNVMLLARKESPSMTLQPHVGKVLWPKYKKKATARNKHNCTNLSANIYDYNNNCTMFNKLWLIIWKKQNQTTNHSLLWLAGVAHLQREEESLPFFAPEVREDGGGCDGERQRHHNTRLTKRGRRENTTYVSAHQRRPEKPTLHALLHFCIYTLWLQWRYNLWPSESKHTAST